MTIHFKEPVFLVKEPLKLNKDVAARSVELSLDVSIDKYSNILIPKYVADNARYICGII